MTKSNSNRKKIIIIVGTRPNFIKITQFEKEFSRYSDTIEYVLIHTNQHYDEEMSKIFFKQLRLKEPEYLDIKPQGTASYIGEVIIKLETAFINHNPDAVIVVGDVNSTMAAAISANKLNIKLFHLESGLRSFDRTMPEELNREITDILADHYFVTEQSGIDNLLKEGKSEAFIHFVGNTMIDSMVAFEDAILEAPILDKLGVEEGKYALITMHRPSNVDTLEKLKTVLEIIKKMGATNKVVLPLHHRTKNSLEKHDLYDQLVNTPNLIITKSLSYLAFQKLILFCKYVVTDSGGIQEETTFKRIPCLTLRENTERPSTISLGTNTLLPLNYDLIKDKILEIESGEYKKGEVPSLWDGKATARIVDLLAKIV